MEQVSLIDFVVIDRVTVADGGGHFQFWNVNKLLLSTSENLWGRFEEMEFLNWLSEWFFPPAA